MNDTSPGGETPFRLFLALELPAAARDAIVAAAAPGRDAHPQARWLLAEDLHVTLKFLGPTDLDQIAWVSERVARVAVGRPSIDTSLGGLGAFPSSRRARVVWMGLDDRLGAMTEMAGALDGELERGFPAETRAFTPHVTLARCDPPLRLPESLVAAGSEPLRLDRLVLFRSHLGRGAPRYEPLETWRLAHPT